ncbi:hypothetical protein DPMN_028731 [Dreissena polymorpha]|uniref:Uncharacterized protein n=1 Tax=Dreissena polymorpha TaxID=45954 RepID=A0A9D4LXP7_DREPO|nr:hypothetical protein DPMN_028731 [Dreissena polymorpha]
MANGGVLKQNAMVCHPVENDEKFYIVCHRQWQTVEYIDKMPPFAIQWKTV